MESLKLETSRTRALTVKILPIEINTVLLTKVKHVLPFVLTIALRKQHLWEGGMFSTIVELFQNKNIQAFFPAISGQGMPVCKLAMKMSHEMFQQLE